MKTICILSNGPSVDKFDISQRMDFYTIIGVNKTVEKWACDWWCFCDYKTINEVTPLGSPVLFTKHIAMQKFEKRSPDRYNLFDTNIFIGHEDIVPPDLPDDAPPWNAFSGCAALGLAYHLKAEQVIVYGADMAGDSDCKGDIGLSRDDSRWKHERRIWDMLVMSLYAQGVGVRRVI